MVTAKQKKIVFVCTGNTCRSPMAEAAFSAFAQQKNLPVIVMSAGIKVSPNERDINPKALAALRHYGLDFPYFSSTSLTKETLLSADIVLCMTRQQRDLLKSARKRLLAESGKTRAKNTVFCFFDLTGADIPDPYGKGEEVYLSTLEAIMSAFPIIVEKWFTKKLRVTKKAKQTTKTAEKVTRNAKKSAKNSQKEAKRQINA